MKRPRKQSEWKKVMRAEAFSVYQSRLQASRFRINWSDQGGVRRRYKLWAESLEEAAQKAQDLIAGRDPDQAEEEAAASENGPLVVEAFEQALGESKRGKLAKRDWTKVQNRFIEWMAKHHPEATHWSLITRRMLREYMAPMTGKAPNTIRLAMNPIVQTAGYMEREYNLPNVAKRLGIGNKLKKTPPLVHVVDVADFLDWLAPQDIRIAAGAALQSLAGLQLMEALRLTWGKVDLKRSLIEISGEVKNSYRNRVIPVSAKVVQILDRCRREVYGQSVEPNAEDPVVPSPTGVSYMSGEDSSHNYSKRLRGFIRQWNATAGWAAKDLRNALPTFAVIEGIHSNLWEQYIGHAPVGVTARHYTPKLTSATRGEGEALERQMDLFRKLVLGPIEEKMARKGHDERSGGEAGDPGDSSKSIEISG